MKKSVFFIRLFLFGVLLFICSSPTSANNPSPTPTIEPLPTSDEVCDNNSTTYPPNSTCYQSVRSDNTEIMGVNLFDSSSSFITYPLSCSPGPIVTYKETEQSTNPDLEGTIVNRNVTISTDLSELQLGFLGPDSNTKSTTNPDTLARTYLFNALFDRPGATANNQKESFRTYWRMLSSLSQAQLKAYYLSVSNPDNTFHYVGSDYKQKTVKNSDLVTSLKNEDANCLYKYTDLDHLTDQLGIDFWNTCWKNNVYAKQYLRLSSTTKEQYDQLMPFDFSNMRAYVSNGTDIAKENIPYLRAILTGLKGYRSDIITPIYVPGIGLIEIPYTVIPGLVDYYTPSWTVKPLALYPTIGSGLLTETQEQLQTDIMNIISAFNQSCVPSSHITSAASPKTYPKPSNMGSQTLTIKAQYHLVSKESGSCSCPDNNTDCTDFDWNCSNFSYEDCPIYCKSTAGKNNYEISGTGTGHSLTVFNNPYITSLTDLVMGGRKFVTNTSQYHFAQTIIDAINAISDKLINPVQPSFYKMLLPSFATDSADNKYMIGASKMDNTVTTSRTNATATIQGDETIYRENNLSQDAMSLLQNCWLVPADQQKSSKCGKSVLPGECKISDTPLSGSCTKDTFTQYLGIYGSPLSPYIPNVTPELSAVYAEAEKRTGTSCVILAAIHFMEANNNPCLSLVSGRKIGEPEPDHQGAVYNTLLETAIAAGNEFQGKLAAAQNVLPAGSPASNILITAFSFYNGGGNSNCLSDPPASQYGSCPPAFRGEDDPYATSLLDSRHANMRLRCTRDGYCGDNLPFSRPGAYTVALNYYLSLP